MGHMDHFSAGWVTPVLSFAMACVGAALGLRCTVRALEADGASKRNWLLLASVAIGSGIWTMHFVAMLGFGVDGTPIRYDVPLTVLSLVVAVLVVGVGVFTAGYGRSRVRAVLLGGLGTGLGVAAMHYIGMAALNLHGTVRYDPALVIASVAIAVVAATAALTLSLVVRGPVVATVAALVMGLAVSSMHYTAMYAVSISLAPSSAAWRVPPPRSSSSPSPSSSAPSSSWPPRTSRSPRPASAPSPPWPPNSCARWSSPPPEPPAGAGDRNRPRAYRAPRPAPP